MTLIRKQTVLGAYVNLKTAANGREYVKIADLARECGVDVDALRADLHRLDLVFTMRRVGRSALIRFA